MLTCLNLKIDYKTLVFMNSRIFFELENYWHVFYLITYWKWELLKRVWTKLKNNGIKMDINCWYMFTAKQKYHYLNIKSRQHEKEEQIYRICFSEKNKTF